MEIIPSLLNSNIYDIKETIEIVKNSGSNFLHIDVMDGKFVPLQAFGGKVVSDLKKRCDILIDVHLMIEDPLDHLSEYQDADRITVHAESTPHIYRCLQNIKKMGIKAGVAVNPGTSIHMIEDVLPLVDQVLIMTVNPAGLGESFLPHCVEKIQKVFRLREQNHYSFDIEVDGNITSQTLYPCLKAGADLFVCGGYIFNHKYPSKKIQELSSLVYNDARE